jgi:CRISPR/Cas system endoribonuclease Cas6 (RAMP superfamily)
MEEFSQRNLNNVPRWIIESGLDAGFSERNNMGFGYMNLIRD